MNIDYLVVGAGASGLAFADAAGGRGGCRGHCGGSSSKRPGGHWQHAYPFVRLHTPSAYYGVNSLPLGEDRIDQAGENAGYYERATGGEVREYFAAAAERLAQTGRVRMLMGHEHLGRGSNGERSGLEYGESFTTSGYVARSSTLDTLRRRSRRLTPPRLMWHRQHGSSRSTICRRSLRSGAPYAVLGSGKTAVDACVWLLENDVEPDRIRWIRPRDAWFYDRRHFQPLDQVAAIMEGISLDAEAGARATNVEDLFDQLESSGRLVRIDPSWPATMYRGTMVSAADSMR